jgi:PAS domain S-box-containing protein
MAAHSSFAPFAGTRSDAGKTVVRYLFVEESVVYVDSSVEVLWGVPASELHREPGLWLEHIHPEDRDRVIDAWRGLEGVRWEIEYRVVRGDAKTSWVRDVGSCHPQGEWRIYGKVTDVTDRRLLEERLRFQSQLLGAVGQAVLATDPKGRVTYWNAGAEQLCGRKAAQVVGRPASQLMVSAAHRAEVERIIARCIAGESWSGQLPISREWEGEVPALVSVAPLAGPHGEIWGVVVVAFDVSDRVRDRDLLAASEARSTELVEQLRRVNSHLHLVREQEQSRIAREIHDELGQLLTALKLEVAWLQRRSSSPTNGLGAEVLRERLAGLAQLADQTLGAMQRIAVQLRPPALDDLGLAEAIDWLCKDFQSRTGVRCSVRRRLNGLAADDARDTAAFRIVQEALTNVARHARARRVKVSAIVDDGTLQLEVRDDGAGIADDALEAPGSLGLVGMRERAVACGGALEVHRAEEDGGTVVLGRLPIGNHQEAS